MDISHIIYFTRDNEKSKPISLRTICLRETYENRLETIFYAVRDAIDRQDFLSRFREICCEQVEFAEENEKQITFKVINACGECNYLRLKKQTKEI